MVLQWNHLYPQLPSRTECLEALDGSGSTRGCRPLTDGLVHSPTPEGGYIPFPPTEQLIWVQSKSPARAGHCYNNIPHY